MRLVVFISSIIGLFLAVGPGIAQQIITEEQAMAAVRAFEGDTNLQVTNVEIKQNTSGPLWYRGCWYDIDNCNMDRTWLVNAVTSEVRFAYYGDAYPENETQEPIGPLSFDQCKQIAEDFARSKYSSFDQMNFQLDESEWEGSGWEFEWRQHAAYGAVTPNYVTVLVSPTSGRIPFYSSRRFTTPTPPAPMLTAVEAKTVATEAAGIVTVDWIDDPTLVANPDNTIYWELALGGVNANGVVRGYLVRLDAQTGAILEKAAQAAVVSVSTQRSQSASGLVSSKKLMTSVRSLFG